MPPLPLSIPKTSRAVYASKTQVVNAIIALAPLYPPAFQWIQSHAVLTLQLVVYGNMLLRFISHGRVSLFGSDS